MSPCGFTWTSPNARTCRRGLKTATAEHPAGFSEISSVKIGYTVKHKGSAVAQEIARLGLLSFIETDERLLELGFDGEVQGQSEDFRPALPLVIKW